jgi:hypothetical protein
MGASCTASAQWASAAEPQAAERARPSDDGTTAGGSVVSLLRPEAKKGARTQVLVLGTPHLRTLAKQFNPAGLERLLAILVGFKPDMVCAEALSGEAVARLEMQTDPASKTILDAFADRQVRLGKTAQSVLRCTRADAAAHVAELLKAPHPLDRAAHSRLILNLLAAFDEWSAMLHWSTASSDVRASLAKQVPEFDQAAEKQLRAADEIGALAIPLAARLKLSQITAVDEHYDDLMLQSVPPADLEAFARHPLFQQTVNSSLYRDSEKTLKEANRQADLWPAYMLMNSRAYMTRDVATQWGFFLKTRLPSGVDRRRYALWEARNMNIAANIACAASSVVGGRVVVIIGAAHKPFLDDYLSRLVLLEMVQLDDVAKSPRGK